jgi:hypothetical protein
LFLAGQDQFDCRAADSVDDIEILLAWDAVDSVDTRALQGRNQQVGSFDHQHLLGGAFASEDNIIQA